MKNQINNILGLFVRIIDAEKCYKDLNKNSATKHLWTNQFIRNKAGETEWEKYNYLPKNGDIGEIVAKLDSAILIEPVFIVRTFGMFYVPIRFSGFEKIDVKQSINI